SCSLMCVSGKPTPLLEPLEISSDSSGPAEGGDPTDDDTATAGADPGGAETKGEGSRGAATGGATIGRASSGGATTGGADSGGAASPSGGGALGDLDGGPRAGQPPQLDILETLSPQAMSNLYLL
ncbi:unnamed protein product, partial [Closterium sp. NIES-54]